jgi:tetratricopeptide (TPR) repeat protein
MRNHFWSKRIVLCLLAVWSCCTCFADERLYQQARTQQREGKFDEAIATFQNFLTQPVDEKDFENQEHVLHTEALMQLMNTFQSKGDLEGCLVALQEVYKASPTLQKQCLRDYYAVMGYALSRTERMREAEETMLKVFTLPLHQPTPERYFRDYAYAAAVFYGNAHYQKEVSYWCMEALKQAELCKNTSGKQWVMTMLGSHYKRHGQLNKALELYLKSKEEARRDKMTWAC